MMRSAAKNHSYVTVVTDPTQYEELCQVLHETNGSSTLKLRTHFATQAFALSASYDRAVATYFANQLGMFEVIVSQCNLNDIPFD